VSPLGDAGNRAVDLHDTIVAVSSPLGPALRAIVRLSGPSARGTALAVFDSGEGQVVPDQRGLFSGRVRLAGLLSPLPADLYLWAAPQTYTGEDVAELHVPGATPLVELLVAGLLKAGARAARPGEFTLRAFLAGKLDLPRAEAVLGVIEAGDRTELKQALTQLAGGVTRPLDGLRDDLLNLLADLEAGLDFADEDIDFVDPTRLLHQLANGLARVTLVARQLDERSLGARPFRVVLAGRPNAGKSSLFNALVGGGALVGERPGTTRDYLRARLPGDGPPVELVDTAGWQSAGDGIEEQAQRLGREQLEGADLVLLCLAAGVSPDADETNWLARPTVLAVATKSDRTEAPADIPSTSVVTGEGIEALRKVIVERAASRREPALAPGLSRCRHHVARCLEHLRRAHEMVLFGDPPELLAVELRGALDELGEMVGAVYTDDLLDRIFSRFCIGK
jgi:tRNA modification GTPase